MALASAVNRPRFGGKVLHLASVTVIFELSLCTMFYSFRHTFQWHERLLYRFLLGIFGVFEVYIENHRSVGAAIATLTSY
jgi:hypothetical protein